MVLVTFVVWFLLQSTNQKFEPLFQNNLTYPDPSTNLLRIFFFIGTTIRCLILEAILRDGDRGP